MFLMISLTSVHIGHSKYCQDEAGSMDERNRMHRVYGNGNIKIETFHCKDGMV